MLRDEFAVRAPSAARTADVWREDNVAVADQVLDDGIPNNRVLSIKSVPKVEHRRKPCRRASTLGFVNKGGDFLAIKAAIGHSIRPRKPAFTTKLHRHRICNRNWARPIDRS